MYRIQCKDKGKWRLGIHSYTIIEIDIGGDTDAENGEDQHE